MKKIWFFYLGVLGLLLIAFEFFFWHIVSQTQNVLLRVLFVVVLVAYLVLAFFITFMGRRRMGASWAARGFIFFAPFMAMIYGIFGSEDQPQGSRRAAMRRTARNTTQKSTTPQKSSAAQKNITSQKTSTTQKSRKR